MDEAAIFFGGSASGCRFKCGEGFALGGKLKAALAAFFGFTKKSLCDRGGATHGANDEDFNGEFTSFVADEEMVTDSDFPGGFGGVGIGVDAAEFAGA